MGRNREKKKGGMCPFLHDVAWAFAAPPGYLWFRPKTYYISQAAKKKIKGGALLVSNHVGFYDPVYLMFAVGYRRHHFIATKELFSTRCKKFFFEKVFLCIRLDRDGMGMSTVRAAVEELKRGGLVSMFPEGHINFDGTDEVKAFKAGAALMALKSGCPIVPVYIHKRKNIWHRQIAVIGEPIPVSLPKDRPVLEYLDDITRLLREKEEELESEYRTILCKKKKRSKQ